MTDPNPLHHLRPEVHGRPEGRGRSRLDQGAVEGLPRDGEARGLGELARGTSSAKRR